jgi:hypothetical protein
MGELHRDEILIVDLEDGNWMLVPERGLEPPLPCENQVLNLARLPVPPFGHKCGMRSKFILPATFCFVNASAQSLPTLAKRAGERLGAETPPSAFLIATSRILN